ncbi:hypothetical protein STRTUCAR8_04773 [Streptomyces turgidiscabies Car8]|uniref:Uncharacterized protein n=1 Tax=Streptomyces turgidiscabies (strain Car8) TaxID=698760 RepID=L7ETG1_STRT8|nr:hypothetical protein STRTUCAR8_04773 [Streptomyces turgidiscabies Car8]
MIEVTKSPAQGESINQNLTAHMPHTPRMRHSTAIPGSSTPPTMRP